LIVSVLRVELTPSFVSYIKQLRAGPETQKEFKMFNEELKNAGLGAATLKNLSEISTVTTSFSRDVMDTA
jgi:hypothetical protein